MTRGERNNNPGNIVRNGIKWRGMAAEQTDSRFIQFITAADGIRALARVLWAYQVVHGLTTVKEIIDRWAPPVENDTDSYCDDVCKRLNVEPHDSIDLENGDTLKRLVAAIIHHENGECIYSDYTLTIAVKNALS